MKAKTLFPACLLVITVNHAQGQTLVETIQRAVIEYPTVNSAKFSAEAAKHDIDSAFAQHLPQVSIDASANQFESSNKYSRDIISPKVSMNLWAGGRIQSNIEKAEHLAQSADSLLVNTQDEIVIASAEAYLQWAKSKELQKLAQENLAVHQTLYDSIQKIVQLDPGRKIDLTQAQVRLDGAKIALTSRSAEAKQSAKHLQRFWPDQLPENPEGVDDFRGILPSNLDDAFAIIEQQHPALTSAQLVLNAAEATLNIAKSQYQPQINLSVNRQYNSDSRSVEFMGQATASLPLYSGGSIDAAVGKANADFFSAQSKLDDTRRVLREKISVFWEDLHATKQRAEIGKKQSDMAGNVVTGYKLQFELAKRSLLDLLNVQNDQFNYRSSTVSNEYDYRIARFHLSGALGQLSRVYGGGEVQPQINEPAWMPWTR